LEPRIGGEKRRGMVEAGKYLLEELRMVASLPIIAKDEEECLAAKKSFPSQGG